MAEKLGLVSQWFLGDFAERATINRNAETLSTVEANVAELRQRAQQQDTEILQLRVMVMGLVQLLQTKAVIADTELERVVEEAWTKLRPPQPEPNRAATDPYRNTPAGEPSAEEIAAAKALLAEAQDHHFSKRFQAAKAVYQQIVERYGETKQAAVARQQIDNLRKA